MKSFDDYEKTARKGRPFSNSTMLEGWQWDVCLGEDIPARHCVNDDDENNPCPLITLAILGFTPLEWSGPYGKYRCAEKATEGQKRQRDEVELQQRIADSHYPMFEVGEVSS